jgi:hypothetical protein
VTKLYQAGTRPSLENRLALALEVWMRTPSGDRSYALGEMALKAASEQTGS